MTLLPPHREDLRRSGLNDDTIAGARVYSASERQVRDLLGYGVGAGMVIPYLGVNGANGGRPYVRVRLDRPDKDGGRYRSPKQSQNHLYIPATLDPKRLADVTLPLYVTEGEKKALKAVQEGLVCIGLVGVWGWRTRFPDRTQGVPLPELETLVLAGRTVYIVFDSDRLTNQSVQKAERALAAYLVGRGAEVLRIPLGPGPHGAKVGLDDYLVTHSIEAFCVLEPEPIPAEASAPTAEPDAAPEPKLIREGLDLALAWPDGVRFLLTAIRDGREGVRGELTVSRNGRRLHWGAFALSSTSAREALRKKLETTAPGPPWGEYLEETLRFRDAAREGEPLVTLTGTTTSPTRELMPRFLYEGEPTLLFGDGDTGKSLVALTLAVAVQSATALPCGLKPVRAVPSAYLDWETSRDTVEARLALLAAGLGVDPPAIVYKRMTRPLVDEANALAAEFARRGIGFVVIDSKMFAVAGAYIPWRQPWLEPEPELVPIIAGDGVACGLDDREMANTGTSSRWWIENVVIPDDEEVLLLA